MLIWFWLQNQYFTSLENALSISNNQQSAREPHNPHPATLTLALNSIVSVLFAFTHNVCVCHQDAGLLSQLRSR